MRRAREWTGKEDDFLRANLGRLSPAEIAEGIGVTTRQVTNRMYVLGLSRTKTALDRAHDGGLAARRAYSLHTFDQLDLVEIAERLGVPRQRVADLLETFTRAMVEDTAVLVSLKDEYLRGNHSRKTGRALAAALGQSYAWVKRRLKFLGIASRKREALTREALRSELQSLHAAGEIDWAHTEHLRCPARRLYGSWESALQAAGVDPGEVRPKRRQWDQEAVLEAIRERHRTGRPLRRNEVWREDVSLVSMAAKYVGPWKSTVELALGVTYEEVVPRRKPSKARPLGYWNRERVLEQVRERAARRKSLALGKVTYEDGGLVTAATTHWGGWREAIEAAGLHYNTVSRIQRWTDEQVVEAILARRDGGLPLDREAVRDEDPSLLRVAEYRYGSWYKAVEEVAGVDGRQDRFKTRRPMERQDAARTHTREEILEWVRQLVKRGEHLAGDNIRKKYRGLYQASLLEFGSWKAAREAAGIEGDVHRWALRWDREAVRSMISERHREEQPLDLRAVDEERPGLVAAARRFWGGWYEALEACGIDSGRWRSTREFSSKEDVTDEILARYRSGSEEERARFLRSPKEFDETLWMHATNYFGSWEAALTAVAFQTIRVPPDPAVPAGSRAAPIDSREQRKPRETMRRRDPWNHQGGVLKEVPPEAQGNRAAVSVLKRILGRSYSGASLEVREVLGDDRELLMAANREFGSWERAVAQALSRSGR